ncbi:MAG: RidA family protein [Elusimicrobiota bacterium]|nr:MAG: RidA family protein [Elusimicrobiota bacterium]
MSDGLSERKIIPVITPKAPQAIGPYSQGISSGNLVFVSGQTPLRADGTLVTGSVAEQTEQCLKNVLEVLLGAGLTMDSVVKTTVYMTDLGKFAEMNEVYAKRFRLPFPARATVQVSALPKGAAVEIDATAVRV